MLLKLHFVSRVSTGIYLCKFLYHCLLMVFNDSKFMTGTVRANQTNQGVQGD